MEKSTENHPGVSGKERNGKTWFNDDGYQEQKDKLGIITDDEVDVAYTQSTGQNLIGKTDLDNQGEQRTGSDDEKSIFETLKRQPEVDVAGVRVKASAGVVTLEGTAMSMKEVRAMINIVQNLPGIKEVVNRIQVIEGTES